MPFRLPRRRPLAALQVEVTSRCPRGCTICPGSAPELGWRNGDLDEATWGKLEDDLGLVCHVQLQGWGEPLLHPRLPEIVGAVKAAGSRVGLTTNGDLLPDAVEWIVDRRVGLVTISMAGSGARHDALRDGSRLQEVWGAIGRLLARRGRRKRPRVEIGYLLTLEGIEDLPRVLEKAAEKGVDELFVIHLDVLPTRELLDRTAFDSSGLRPGAGGAIEAAERAARAGRIVSGHRRRSPRTC